MHFSQHNPLQKNSVHLCVKLFSLAFDSAQGDNRVKLIFKINPIPPICVPKNSKFKIQHSKI